MKDNVDVPGDLLYTNDHIWVLIEDNIASVGITDFAQAELSVIVYIDFSEVGRDVVQGSPFGTIEAMKTVSELMSPVSGEIIERNETLESEPKIINHDPYGEGWMIKVALSNPDEAEALLSPDEYTLYTSGE